MIHEQDKLLAKKAIEQFEAYNNRSKWISWWTSFRHWLGFCYSGHHDWVNNFCHKCGKKYRKNTFIMWD